MAAKFGGELWRQTAREDADGELCQVVDHLRVVSAFAFLRDFVCIKHLFVFLDISCFCFTCLHVRVIFLFMVHLIYKGYMYIYDLRKRLSSYHLGRISINPIQITDNHQASYS